MKNEYDMKKAKQKSVDEQTQTADRCDLNEDESLIITESGISNEFHDDPTEVFVRDGKLAMTRGNYATSNVSPKEREIKRTNEHVEQTTQHSYGGGNKKNGLYSDNAEQNNAFYLSEYQKIGKREHISTGVTRPTFRPREPREAFTANSVSQQHGLFQNHSNPYREKSKISALEKMRKGKEPIKSSHTVCIEALCIALFKVKRFKSFLESALNLDYDDFIPPLFTLACFFDGISGYRVEPSLFKDTINEILEKEASPNRFKAVDFFSCYRSFISCFGSLIYIDHELIERYFYKSFMYEDNTCSSTLTVFFEANFEKLKISSGKTKIKKYKENYYSKQERIPKIFLLIPEPSDVLCENQPFSQLVFSNNVIYYPKSLIIKTESYLQPRYYSYFLDYDSEMWIMLDENGRIENSILSDSFNSQSKICAVFYEDVN